MDRNNNRQDRSGRRRRRAYSLLELLSVIAILALLAAILLPVLSAARERSRRASCANNLHSLHLALAAYLSDNDGQYPPDAAVSRKRSAKPEVWIVQGPWYKAIAPYLHTDDFPTCPDAPAIFAKYAKEGIPRDMGYAYNSRLKTLQNHSLSQHVFTYSGRTESAIPSLSDVVVFFDVRSGRSSADRPDVGAIPKGMQGDSFFYTRVEESKVPPGAVRHDGGANYVFGDGHLRWLRPEQLSPANFLRSK
jgi:prepilin-type N-terminal cleavage/methylation domain-containing protein/prepilin-type processing-associated H-X9-DG protein